MEQNNQIPEINVTAQNAHGSSEVRKGDYTHPIPGYCAYVSPAARELSSKEREKRILHFRFFSIASLIYAVFYTFCLYRNPSGVTWPFFIGGTLFYFFLFIKKSGISAKKDSIFYIAALILLSVSNFCTDDRNLLFWNKIGIFMLMFCFMLHNVYEDSTWNLSKYLGAVCHTFFGAIGFLGRPFSDFGIYMKHKKEVRGLKDSKGRYVAFGLLFCIPFLFIIVLLLSTADIVFASFIEDILDRIWIPENLFGIIFTLLFAFFASYCITVRLTKKGISEKTEDKRTGEPVLAITVTSLLSVIYVIFSSIQIIYLFFGSLELPHDYTYAEYARQGFFQLLFVCLINLTLVLVCLGRFKESRILKAILTLISLCTYIMTASSAMRMMIYIKYYHLTFLRIFVLWALAVICLLMTGVLISIYKEKFPLFKYSMVIVTVLYIGLSFSHPDYWIARVNTSYLLAEIDFEETGSSNSDVSYLGRLSADAAPVLLTLTEDERFNKYHYTLKETDRDIWWYHNYINKTGKKTENINPRNFNLSRFQAKQLLQGLQ